MADPDASASAIAQSLKFFKENMPALLLKVALDAQLERAKYLECIKVGFTEAQALELCKKTI